MEKELLEKKEELAKTLNKEQKELFNEVCDLEDIKHAENENSTFMFGFRLAVRMILEDVEGI